MAESTTSVVDQAEYKRRIRAWAIYDWANSAFATTILAAVLPVYYSLAAGATLPSAAKATQYWSITLSISVFVVALISPILGTVSDIMRGKKKFLSIFVAIGVIGTGLLVLVDTGDWLLASICFIIGRIGFGAANVFYDSLLPHIATEEDQDRVSTYGYALGYLGGGILLAINIVMITVIWPDSTLGSRLSFLTVAVWWALFSIPIFRTVPEPQVGTQKLAPGESLIRTSFARISTTLREIRSFSELFKYLVAFLIYNDGIGIVISVAAIYGAELGFGSTELILAILLVQFVGIPYSIVFGNIPSKANKRQSMYVAFVVFNIIALPLTGIIGARLLPKAATGLPSPDFAAIGEFVGQGTQTVDDDGFTFNGDFSAETVAADLRGATCSWFAFWCEDTDGDATYTASTTPGDSVSFNFNGQPVGVTYSTGPDHGTWGVLMDGEPLLDGDGAAVTIDAYRATERFEESAQFEAPNEGQHTLTLVNLDEANSASSGNRLAVSAATVLPPLRTSNLGTIIGVLLASQVVGLAFAFLLGPRLFKGLAERLDTKSSIMLALSAYAIIAVWGFFLNSVIEFWFLAWMVSVVQGGSQALSRSLYASMTPTAMSGEFFGFFSIMSKFASFLSPLVFVLSVAFFNSSRPGVLSLIFFFGIGMYLLSKVDVEAGKAHARAKDAEIQAAASG